MIAASIDHPNVIPVYEAGEEDGALFIAMRWVEGTNLREPIDRGALEPCACRPARLPGRERTRCSPRARPDPPRRQARQHPDHGPGPRLPDRLRAHEARQLDQRADENGSVGGHGGLHGAGADRGNAREPADRRVLARLRLLRGPDGAAPFKRENDLATLWAHVYAPPPSVHEVSPDTPAGLSRSCSGRWPRTPRTAIPSAGELGRAALAAAEGAEVPAVPPPPPIGRARASEPNRPRRARKRRALLGSAPATRVRTRRAAAPGRRRAGGRAAPRIRRSEDRPRRPGDVGSLAGRRHLAPPAPMPTARQNMASTVARRDDLGGGRADSGSTASRQVEGYDPVINGWKSAPDLPVRLHHEMVVTYKDEIVVIGGWITEGIGSKRRDQRPGVRAARDGGKSCPPCSGPRAAGAAAVVGDRIVVVGGQDDGRLLDTTEVFDGKKWSIGAKIPTPREHLAAASDGRFAYAVGGRTLSSDKNSAALERYDPATDSWQRLPDMPNARGGLGAADRGRQSARGRRRELDATPWATSSPTTSRARPWSERPLDAHPQARTRGGRDRPHALRARRRAATRPCERIGDCGGARLVPGSSPDRPGPLAPPAPDAHSPPEHGGHGARRDDLGRGRTRERLHRSRQVEGYDPVINGWKSAPDLPVRLHHEMVVTYKDEIVVIGGWIPKGSDPSAEITDRVFALRADAGPSCPPCNGPRAAGAAAVVGDRIVVAGGQADGRLIDTTEVFDGEEWSIGAKIPTPREHLAAVSDGDYLYAVGGRALSPDKNSAALERYDPAADRWQRLADMPNARGGIGAAIADGQSVRGRRRDLHPRPGHGRVLQHRPRRLVERPLDAHPQARPRGGRDRPHPLRARRRAATRPRERIGDRGSAQAHALSDPTPAQNRTGPLP